MSMRLFAAVIGVIALAESQAYGGTITPNLPYPAPDPMSHPGTPKTQLCKTVTTQQCMNYQGNPPHCTNYQSVSRQVCS